MGNSVEKMEHIAETGETQAKRGLTVTKPDNCIIVIFGGSGDLTKRKLMPSLFDLYQNNHLPDNFAVLGLGTTSFSDDTFRDKMAESVKEFLKSEPIKDSRLPEFLKHIYYFAMDQTSPENYAGLRERLEEVDRDSGTGGNYIYYLATIPRHFEIIARNLGQQDLHREEGGQGWRRIVIEKPFGFDLRSAMELNRNLQEIFREDQIYRIDHYLGKETVQNITALRFANGIFEPLWNRNYIHHVEVTAAESIGVEDRGGYYEGAGALRDMVQNHLLQVVSTIGIEPPARFDANSVRNEKIKLFESLRPIEPENVNKQVVRGQYLGARLGIEEVPGYRSEKKVAQDSRTETFVAMKFYIDNWRWGGVPFYVRTGKRLASHITEAVIHFKKTPHNIFARELASDPVANELIIRIQPNEGILLRFGLKMPGAGFQIKTVKMDFHYSELGKFNLPDAYERLLLDCMLGDATLYARADSVEACWKFLMPVMEVWKNDPAVKLCGYRAGSWGPKQSSLLFEESGEAWHNAYKEINDGGECIAL